MISTATLEALLLALAWAATLSVRPWRLLRARDGQVPLATPLLAGLTLLPWLWAWPGVAALPFPLHWSGAPLLVLVLGWPLAIPVATFAGLSTMLTTGASLGQALSVTVWAGVLPATAVLALGHVVRKGLGAQPLAYVLGRGFFVPLVALAVCALAAAALGDGFTGTTRELQRVAILLMALGEASWTCALVSVLAAWRPQWLATWSDRLYLGSSPRPVRVRPDR